MHIKTAINITDLTILNSMPSIDNVFEVQSYVYTTQVQFSTLL